MPPITHDQVFAIACASPMLDRVEAYLREQGHTEQADVLCKLQQDVGVMFARHEYNHYDPTVGAESAALDKNFAQIMPSRLQIVLEESARYVDKSLQAEMQELLKEISPPPLLAAPPVQGVLAKPGLG